MWRPPSCCQASTPLSRTVTAAAGQASELFGSPGRCGRAGLGFRAVCSEWRAGPSTCVLAACLALLRQPSAASRTLGQRRQLFPGAGAVRIAAAFLPWWSGGAVPHAPLSATTAPRCAAPASQRCRGPRPRLCARHGKARTRTHLYVESQRPMQPHEHLNEWWRAGRCTAWRLHPAKLWPMHDIKTCSCSAMHHHNSSSSRPPRTCTTSHVAVRCGAVRSAPPPKTQKGPHEPPALRARPI